MEEKRIALIGNNTKKALKWIQGKKRAEARRLKASNMQIRRKLQKKENYCHILVEKYVDGSYRWSTKNVVKKSETERSEIRDKYAQLNRFHLDFRLQVYMYDFMYVYPQKIPGEDNFPATRIFIMNYKNMSTPGLVPNIWLGFSYISLEDYELDKNFDGTELKKIR